MKMNYVEDIREEFRQRKAEGIHRGNTIEIQNAQFRCDAPTIFGQRNEEYITAEIKWYESGSLNVHDLFQIYGKPVQIWKDIADDKGYINSNYGWCIYSLPNGDQYEHVRRILSSGNQMSRQAVMHYTRPSMHHDWKRAGMRDFMCTFAVQYFVNDGYLEASVYMRSNDAIFGYNNDFAWQRHVLLQLSEDLKLTPGSITWHAASLHIYERHWNLIC